MSYQKQHNIKDISYALSQNALENAQTILNQPGKREGQTLRFGKNQALSIKLSGTRAGRWVDYSEPGKHGDLIDLIMYVHNINMHQAIDYACEILGHTIPTQKRTPEMFEAQKEQEREELISRTLKAEFIWSKMSTKPLNGAMQYLAGRKLRPTSDMRWGKMGFQSASKMFSLTQEEYDRGPLESVGIPITDINGKLCGLQQIWTQNGQKLKTQSQSPCKRSSGVIHGNAWRIGRKHSDTMIVCEGPETGMAIHQSTGLNVCVAAGTDLLYQIQIPEHVKKVLVAIDSGKAGLISGEMTVKHFTNQNKTCRMSIEPRLEGIEKCDYWDIYDRLGEKAVLEMLQKLPPKTT